MIFFSKIVNELILWYVTYLDYSEDVLYLLDNVAELRFILYITYSKTKTLFSTIYFNEHMWILYIIIINIINK